KHLLKRLEINDVRMADVTLHIGLGTFEPVEVEDLSKHKMPSEEGRITQATAELVNATKAKRKKVCAVGTSSMRIMESAVSSNGELNTFNGWTHQFIFPPYEFSIANCMITNFHMPKNTLAMMSAAFMGYDLMKEVYDVAIKEKYKFFTYGDALLIL